MATKDSAAPASSSDPTSREIQLENELKIARAHIAELEEALSAA